MATGQHASPAETSKPSPFHRIAESVAQSIAKSTAPWFAEAASTMAGEGEGIGTALPVALPAWASHALYALQTVAVPLAFWFKPVCVCVAAFWLIYRAYLVLTTPLESLALLLGVDIPPTPTIDLAAIKADGAILHWSLPSTQKAKMNKFKYEIHVNGNVIDTVSIHETAVTITGLLPSSFYVVRVALVNDAELASRSEPIRFKTKPASSCDFFVAGADGHETDHDGSAETLPRVRLYRGLKDITPASIEAAPTMIREGSNSGLLPAKRSITGRRPSPAVLGLETKGLHDPAPDDNEPPEGAETIQQLTQRLDTLRRETDEAEAQAKEEEEAEERLRDELMAERDELRAEVTEKEKASRNLKREVNTLERQNTAAQNERTKHERLLSQKKLERERLKDDLVRWEKEAVDARADAERLRREKEEHILQFEKEKEELRKKVADEVAAMKILDDEIKEKNAEMRRLERATKNPSPVDGGSGEQQNAAEVSLVQEYQQHAEEDRQWLVRQSQLQQQYSMTYQKLEAAKRFHTEQMRYLESVRAERRAAEEQRREVHAQTQTGPYASPVSMIASERLPRRGDSQRSRRAPSGQSTSDSPRLATFAPLNTHSASPFGGFPASTAASFFNPNNGMTLAAARPSEDVQLSDEDRERLTGGAPMSPGAGVDLLPADLFAGEGDRADRGAPGGPGGIILPGLGLPGLPGPELAGLAGPSTAAGAQQSRQEQNAATGPASPVESDSRSPSVFASPQVSQQNLHLGSPSGTGVMGDWHGIDADRRSVRSTRSNRATSGGAAAGAGSRFSSMFGIKARTKGASLGGDEAAGQGLVLGKAQSQSLPRQDGQGVLPGLLDASGRRRNLSISGGGGVEGELGVDGVGGEAVMMAETPVSTSLRRRAFGMGGLFNRGEKSGSGSGGDGWPSSFTSSFGRRPGSPRPGSTHSNELPRPSTDGSRWGVDAWPSGSATGDAAGGARSSPLSFGPGTSWNVPNGGVGGGRLYGSRHPSRRPSVQYGASMGPPEDIMEDEASDEDDDDDDGPDVNKHLAPIGTKPTLGKGKQAETSNGEDGTSGSAAARLNPAARDFKSLFGKWSKDKPSTATTSGSNDGAATPTPDLRNVWEDDTSPPNSRKSRDARSMTTTESSITGESGRASNDLIRTPSHTNSDATGPSPANNNFGGSSSSAGKESFMAKITRKSSSGKFGLPTFKREKSKYLSSSSGADGAPTPLTQTPTEEEVEEPLSASVGSLRASGGGGGSGRGWSQFVKLGKGRKETPSLSGVSAASGTEGEDGEEE